MKQAQRVARLVRSCFPRALHAAVEAVRVHKGRVVCAKASHPGHSAHACTTWAIAADYDTHANAQQCCVPWIFSGHIHIKGSKIFCHNAPDGFQLPQFHVTEGARVAICVPRW